MKKKLSLSLASCLLATQLFAIDFNIDWEDILSGNFNFSSLLNDVSMVDTVTQCYKPNIDLSSITDICKLLEYSRSEAIGVCSLAPDIIPGFSALNEAGIEQKFGVSTNKLQSYCNELKSEATSYLSKQKERFGDLTSMTTNLWALQNDVNGEGKLPNGQELNQFYDDISLTLEDENLIKENEDDSLFHSYLSSKDKFHQATARFMMGLGMNMDLTEPDRLIKLKIYENTVLAPINMTEYNKKVVELSNKINDDLDLSSPTTISENLSAILQPYQSITGKEISEKLAEVQVDYTNKRINENAREKKGMLKTLLSSEDDLAIPTQETLNNYGVNVRPKYAMLMQRQQIREAYIDAMVDTETKLKQDIVNLSKQKAIIMKSAFDKKGAEEEIDNLINDSGLLGDILDKVGSEVIDAGKDIVGGMLN